MPSAATPKIKGKVIPTNAATVPARRRRFDIKQFLNMIAPVS